MGSCACRTCYVLKALWKGGEFATAGRAPHCGTVEFNPYICLCQSDSEVVKSIFCRAPDNVFKRKRILYMCLHCDMMREKRKEGFEWKKRSFQRLVSILEKRKARWHSYWVFRLKPYKALNRGGGISQSILNVRSFFF
jgi:hypothetical protein